MYQDEIDVFNIMAPPEVDDALAGDVLTCRYHRGLKKGPGSFEYASKDKFHAFYENDLIVGDSLYVYADGREEIRIFQNEKQIGVSFGALRA